MKIKGVYKWQLIDKRTGKVEGRGEQENLITDSFVDNFTQSSGQSKSGRSGRLVLSKQTTPLPSLEFREYGVAEANISSDIMSGTLSFTYDDVAGIASCSNNFNPQGTPQTYTIFGLDLGQNQWRKFLSFVVLTTPVTQLTTQYLYLQYETYMHYDGGLLNSATNDYILNFFNIDIYNRLMWLAYRIGSGGSDNDHLKITSLRPPVTLNNIGRRLHELADFQSSSCPNDGCRYGQTPQRTFGITEIPGIIGVSVWMKNRNSFSPYDSCTMAAFGSSDIVPSISRVYVHPSSRPWEVFSDPSYPPSSRASITLSGTPTNKVPMVVRLQITKTGDASDIVDETFTANPATDELTVGQDDWAVDDIVQFTTTGTLPAPLATSTDYYVVSKSGTSPSPILLEVSLAQGGATVNITDAGTGTHTLSRQNTGRYRLTLQPILSNLSSNRINPGLPYYNIYPLKDAGGEDMWVDDWTSASSYGTIGREGDYIYTVQYNTDATQLMICRQVIFTPECSVPLHSLFGTSGLTFYRVIRGKGTYSDMAYIGTSVGIYSYDFSSPATPTLMSITGMLDTDIRELAFDEITEYLWAGHYRGMSRIDLSTNTATQYDNGSGDPLDGISDTYIECVPGHLTAHNGRVFRTHTHQAQKWLLEDGVGYSYHDLYNVVRGGSTIRKSNGHLVWRSSTVWDVYNVTGITGPNTGTWNYVEHYDPSYTSYTYLTTFLHEVQDDTWRTVVWVNGSVCRVETYQIGGDYSYQESTNSLVARLDSYDRVSAANGRNPIDITEGGMGLSIQLTGYSLIYGSPRELYGWNGSAWEKANVNDRQITKTVTHSLSQGISVEFVNAVGENWDDQFVLDELFTFVISPTLIKDNLQEYTVKGRAYHCSVKRVNNWTTTIAATVTVPEAPTGSSPDADFRDLDHDPVVLEVYNVTAGSAMTQVSSPPGDGQYSVTGLLDGTFEFHANQIGDSVRISYNYTCYY